MQLEYPESPIILLSQDRDQGLIPTRNFGLDHATGDILGRIDADSVLEPDWVEQVQKAFADPSVHAATGPVVYYDMPMRRFGLKADDKMRQLMLKLAKHQYHFLFGSNMALRRSAWEIIRGETCRDEKDEMHEDIDLSLHLADHDLEDPVLAADGLRDVRPAAGGLAPRLPVLRDPLRPHLQGPQREEDGPQGARWWCSSRCISRRSCCAPSTPSTPPSQRAAAASSHRRLPRA